MVHRTERFAFAVIFGLPLTIIVLVVAAAITDNPWLLVAMIAVVWCFTTLLPTLARHETRRTRSVAGIIGCAGLGLLIASIALRNPWLFLAVAMMIVIGGIVLTVVYALIKLVAGREPPL